jgi:hypothetical protein
MIRNIAGVAALDTNPSPPNTIASTPMAGGHVGIVAATAPGSVGGAVRTGGVVSGECGGVIGGSDAGRWSSMGGGLRRSA